MMDLGLEVLLRMQLGILQVGLARILGTQTLLMEH